MKEQIEALNSTLKTYQDAYYNGTPIVPDDVYDREEIHLINLVKKYPEYRSIATVLTSVGDSTNSDQRINHVRPMKSIENHYTLESASNVSSYGNPILVEPKRDGISSELYYRNGLLVRNVTRGDGTSGEDMTQQTEACPSIPKIIPTDITNLRIRGEMVMRKSELARINQIRNEQGLDEYSNPRNLVAGTMKQLDFDVVAERKIELIPWDVYSPDEDYLLPDSSYARMKMLESFGFAKYQGMLLHSTDDIPAAINKILADNEQSDIVADGVVIKADSHIIRNQLGYGTKFAKFQHCFKPQQQQAETTVTGITWGVGRQGKVTPVLLVTPVDLGGAMISKATGNNLTWMQNLNVKIGSVVSILRSGDVIPMICDVLDNTNGIDIIIPENCPECGHKLIHRGDNGITLLMCENRYCKGKAAEIFFYVGDRKTLEITALGEEMSKTLVSLNITNLAELFEFAIYTENNKAHEFVHRGFPSGVMAFKLVQSLLDAKTRSWSRWFAAMSIPMVGHTLGKTIVEKLNLTSDDMGNLCDKLLTLKNIPIAGLGEVKLNNILAWADDVVNRDMCERLYQSGVRPTVETPVGSVGGPLNGITFCITGTFHTLGTRTQITEKLVAQGAVSVSSVNKSCNLLIVGDAAGSKLEKAQKLGIKIVDEDWLKDKI